MCGKKGKAVRFFSVLMACTLPGMMVPADRIAAMDSGEIAAYDENVPANQEQASADQSGTSLDLSGNDLQDKYEDIGGGTITVESGTGSGKILKMNNVGSSLDSSASVNIILSGEWEIEQEGTNRVSVTLKAGAKLTIPENKEVTLVDVKPEENANQAVSLINNGILKLPPDAKCLSCEEVLSANGSGQWYIETEADTEIEKISLQGTSGYNDPKHLVFTGQGTLTITDGIQLGSNGDTMTIQEGADVVITGQSLGIGGSGSEDGTVAITNPGSTLTLKESVKIDKLHVTGGGKLVAEKTLTLCSPLEIEKGSELELQDRPAMKFLTTSDTEASDEENAAFAESMEAWLPDYYYFGKWTSQENPPQTYFTILDKETDQPPIGGLTLKQYITPQMKLTASSDLIHTGGPVTLTIADAGNLPDEANIKITCDHPDIEITPAEGTGRTRTAVLPDTPGTYQFTASFRGDENCNSATAECSVTVGEPVSIADAQITLDPSEFTYDGKPKEPSALVAVAGSTLAAGTDYAITYTDNSNAGEAKAVITGTGGYCGEKTEVFRILPAVPALSWEENATQAMTYNGRPASIAVPPAVTLANGEEFQGTIYYSYAADGKTEFTEGLPTDAGVYRIKAKIEAEGNYTAAESSNTLTLTIRKPDSGTAAPGGTLGTVYPGSNPGTEKPGSSNETPCPVCGEGCPAGACQEETCRKQTVSAQNPDGSITTTITERDENCSVIRTTIQRVEVVDGKTIVTCTIQTADGTEKTVTTKQKKADGTSIQTQVHTAIDGKVTTTVTTIKPNGIIETAVTETIINSKGNEVVVTTTTRTKADKTVLDITVSSFIQNLSSDAQATVIIQKDGTGKVTGTSAAITKTLTGSSSTVSLTETELSQIKEAAGEADTAFTVTAKKQDGKTACTIKANTKDLKAGAAFSMYGITKKTGTYYMVNSKTYTADSSGGITFSCFSSGDYELVPSAQAKTIDQQILKTAKPLFKSISVKKNSKRKISMSFSLNRQNVKKITYQSLHPDIATVSSNGTITAKKKGKAIIKVQVKFINNKTKSFQVKVTVKR